MVFLCSLQHQITAWNSLAAESVLIIERNGKVVEMIGNPLRKLAVTAIALILVAAAILLSNI